ncbi:hypothetical protein CsatB_021742 [Cannabis sativa]
MEKKRKGSAPKKAVAVAVAVAVAWLGAISGATAKAVLHKVGGSKGWNENVNYTQWSTTNAPFFLGDWLYFVFDKRYYNVLEVNETSYESCNDKIFLKNVTRGGRDVFQLTESKPYYFISGGGYCFHGMRLTISVVKDDATGGSATLPPAIANADNNTFAPVVADAPAKNSSPSSLILHLDLLIYLVILYLVC